MHKPTVACLFPFSHAFVLCYVFGGRQLDSGKVYFPEALPDLQSKLCQWELFVKMGEASGTKNKCSLSTSSFCQLGISNRRKHHRTSQVLASTPEIFGCASTLTDLLSVLRFCHNWEHHTNKIIQYGPSKDTFFTQSMHLKFIHVVAFISSLFHFVSGFYFPVRCEIVLYSHSPV